MYKIKLTEDSETSIICLDGEHPWLNEYIQEISVSSKSTLQGRRVFIITYDPQRKSCDDIIDKVYKLTGDMLPRSGWLGRYAFSYHLWRHPGCDDLIFEVKRDQKEKFRNYQLAAGLVYLLYEAVFWGPEQGLPLHAACIERDGAAFLLCGDSGTGKSTCCQRIPFPWRALTDEETLVARSSNGGYFARALPNLADLTRQNTVRAYNVPYALPISALFFLQKANADQLHKIVGAEATIKVVKAAESVFVRYHNHINDKISFRKRQLENAVLLIKSVPNFVLSVFREGAFWRTMEEVTNGIHREAGSKPDCCLTRRI